MLCNNCGEEIGDLETCPHCGSPQNEEEPIKETTNHDIVQTENNLDNIFCTNCGKEIIGDVTFCPQCGTKLDSPQSKINETKNSTKFCQNCGKEIDEKAVICPHCGVGTGVSNPKSIQQRTKFCQNCGKEIDEKAVICPHCGVGTGPLNYNKSVALAFILNLLLGGLLPGIGQIYLGLSKKGIMLIIAYWICWFTSFLVIPLLLVVIIYFYALIDAIISGQAINNGENVEDSLFGYSF